MTPQLLTGRGYEDLASESNGIRVTLMWTRTDDDVKVAVYDASTDSAFELAVGDAAPLEVFHHPYAYAAFPGVACDGCPCESSPHAVAA